MFKISEYVVIFKIGITSPQGIGDKLSHFRIIKDFVGGSVMLQSVTNSKLYLGFDLIGAAKAVFKQSSPSKLYPKILNCEIQFIDTYNHL